MRGWGYRQQTGEADDKKAGLGRRQRQTDRNKERQTRTRQDVTVCTFLRRFWDFGKIG